MAVLELSLLGELEVVRDGETLPLPPSRKTRALLAYLAMHPRSFRREYLCELLWEIPDDPRGSLRWSLSKLRRLVDDEERCRIVADRASVALDPTGIAIDAVRLHELADGDLEAVSTDCLEDAAQRYRGNFLEGLELANFHDFHAWCVAAREQVTRAQCAILRTLTRRLRDDPERALPHARSLVTLDPYDEAARGRLIRLLVKLRRADEAEQQYQLGRRMLQEAGIESDGTLLAAWRSTPGSSAPAQAAKAYAAPVQPAGRDLVGRDTELQQMMEAFARVTAGGRAELVLLRGEPGLGKSRLLQAAAALAREAGACVLEASAFEPEAKRPFALWLDALRRVGSESAPAVFDTASRENRDRLFEALGDVIARHASEKPVVLLFDDLQWCDESSAAALHYVVRMNSHGPLLGLLAGRDGELHDNGPVQQVLRGLRQGGLLEEMQLAPLAEDAARRLIEQHAPDADGERLARECAGNPLLAIELARAESAGGSGSSVEDLIRERLSRFDVEGLEVLQWASILAPRIDLSSLTAATGFNDARIAAAVEQAERQALLLPAEGGVRFSHDLLGRAVYAQISPARRQVMHRRVAELLEQDTAVDLEHAADLAHHATQSGDPALAARAMVSAGRLCLRFFANDDAQSLARRGLQLTERLSRAERVRLKLELHDVLLAAAPTEDWEETATEFVALAEQALDHGALAHARLGYQMASYLRWVHGHWTVAREQSLQAERVTRSGTDLEHIVGLGETARCLAMLERDLAHADALLMEAQALCRRHGHSHGSIPAALGMLRYHEDRLEEAEEQFEEARTLCKSNGDRVNEFQALEYLVMIALQRGSYDHAQHRCRELLALGERLREGSEAPFARAVDGLCRYLLDDDDAALLAGLEELRAVDAKFRLAYTLTRAALADVERGRPDRAVTLATEALAAAEVLERSTEMMLAHVALAEAHRERGDDTAFRRHLEAIEAFDPSCVAAWARRRAAETSAAVTAED